jgi:hypothetical protein
MPVVQVWDRWPGSAPPTLAGAASLSLAQMAQMAQPGFAMSRTVLLPLGQLPRSNIPPQPLEELDDGGDEVPGATSLLEVQLQYEAVHIPGSAQQQTEGGSVDLVGTEQAILPDAVEPAAPVGIPATISVEIIQACGLQVRIGDGLWFVSPPI